MASSMNRANGTPVAACGSWAKISRNGAEEPIYKGDQLPTVTAMLKRFLVVVSAVACGFGLAQFAARPGAPSWWPDRERDRNVRYFREVLQIVRENYVEESPRVAYGELTRSALAGMVAEKGASGAVGALQAGREADDEEPRSAGTERWDRPVEPVGMRAPVLLAEGD